MLKYLILFLGLALMVTGCNSLISQQFGTHRLRTLTVDQAAGGVGDADFVRLSDGQLADARLLTGPDTDETTYYLFQPIRGTQSTPMQMVSVVGWWVCEGDHCAEDRPGPPGKDIRGLIGLPDSDFLPEQQWEEQGVTLVSEPVFIQLGEAPLDWYWNLLLFLGGIGLAVGSQYGDFSKREPT